MRSRRACRISPGLETLEARNLQSGLVGEVQSATPNFLLLPYVEQDNIHRQLSSRVERGGGETQIIAVLHGL